MYETVKSTLIKLSYRMGLFAQNWVVWYEPDSGEFSMV